ncbi:MAG: dihydroorotate dehydrogenase [Archaeoglobaceae archaeon]
MFNVRVKKIEKKGDAAIIRFDPPLRAYPGQFVMVNVYGCEEIPLSLCGSDTLAVKAVGETTRKLVNYPEKILGIRGPFGKPFTPVSGESVLIVAGGIGVAPLKFLHEVLRKENDVTVVYGCKSAAEILFEFEDCVYATEDGSLGIKGTVVDAIETLELETFDRVYCCGKEEMMRKVWELFKDHLPPERFEVSMERYMRCGFGVCGSCSLECGLLVCRDGPVFTAEVW